MLKSLKRLRNMPNKTQHTYALNAVCNEIADEIEREIAECYMPLPVDADGVPIHVGDSIEYPCGVCDDVRFITIHSNALRLNEGEWLASKCHHVKPRTVEDVLREYGDAVDRLGQANVDMASYADELQMRDDE